VVPNHNCRWRVILIIINPHQYSLSLKFGILKVYLQNAYVLKETQVWGGLIITMYKFSSLILNSRMMKLYDLQFNRIVQFYKGSFALALKVRCEICL
jgi:hypothetical protein